MGTTSGLLMKNTLNVIFELNFFLFKRANLSFEYYSFLTYFYLHILVKFCGNLGKIRAQDFLFRLVVKFILWTLGTFKQFVVH